MRMNKWQKSRFGKRLIREMSRSRGGPAESPGKVVRAVPEEFARENFDLTNWPLRHYGDKWLAIPARFTTLLQHPSMKLKSLLTILTTLTIGFHTAIGAEEETPLSKNMSAMNKSLRTLKRQIADTSKKDENVAILDKIKTSLTEAAKLQPKKTKEVPEAEKTAYLENYKKQIADLQKTFDEIDAAVKAGKVDDAKALFDKLSEQKEKGHKDFGADDE